MLRKQRKENIDTKKMIKWGGKTFIVQQGGGVSRFIL